MAFTKELHKQDVRKRRRGKTLRGQALVKAAQLELARMIRLSPKTDPINIARLAKRLNVTRQAIYNNELEELIKEHAELQQRNFISNVETTALRRPLEDRIAELEKENEDLRRKLDGWIERWATVEHNARMHGINSDQIFQPMPPPERKTLTFRRSTRRQ